MNSKIKFCLIFSMGFLLGVRCAVCEPLVSIAPSQQEYLSGEPIMLELTVSNESASADSINLGFDFQGDILFASNGRIYQFKRPTQALSKSPIYKIRPNSEYTETILLDDWTGHLPEGLYAFKCSTAARPDLAKAFSVRIVPPNQDLLRKKIVETVKILETTKDASEAKILKRWLYAAVPQNEKEFSGSILSLLDARGTKLFKEAMAPNISYD
jgi:hypothetical protein